MFRQNKIAVLVLLLGFAVSPTAVAAVNDPLIPSLGSPPAPDRSPRPVLPPSRTAEFTVEEAVQAVFGVQMPDDRVIVSDDPNTEWPLFDNVTTGQPDQRRPCTWNGPKTRIDLPVRRYVGSGVSI